MSVLDAEIPIYHQVFIPPLGGVGRNNPGSLSDPILRFVYSVAPMASWGSVRADPIDVDAVARTVQDILIDVPDPSLYKKLDTVVIQGVSYEIQGQPDQNDWGANMPFADYDDMFGAVVHARRVQ